MFATLQLFLTMGLGRSAIVADLVLTGVAAAVGALVVRRALRAQPPVTAAADPAVDVVAEAEDVLASASCPR
jgi:hypothetical protein